MPRKKKQFDPRPLKDQVEEYLFDGIMEFEQISGLKVDRVEVIHHKGIGFGAKDTMEVNIITAQ